MTIACHSDCWTEVHSNFRRLGSTPAAPPTFTATPAPAERLRAGGAGLEHEALRASDETAAAMGAAQELGVYGRLRKVARCGPVLMFRRLLVTWRDTHTPAAIAEKVKTFFRCAARFLLSQLPKTVL